MKAIVDSILLCLVEILLSGNIGFRSKCNIYESKMVVSFTEFESGTVVLLTFGIFMLMIIQTKSWFSL